MLQQTDFKKQFYGESVFKHPSSILPNICNKNGKKGGEGTNL